MLKLESGDYLWFDPLSYNPREFNTKAYAATGIQVFGTVFIASRSKTLEQQLRRDQELPDKYRLERQVIPCSQ